MSASSLWTRLFGWLLTPQAAKAARPARHLRERTQATPAEADEEPQAQDSRHLRGHRREQLFAIVRENMIRAGVLSSAYKFKALTLDRKGNSFIVMFDIDADATDCRPEALRALEHTLQELARERIGIEVKAAYWRAREAPAGRTTDHKPHDMLTEIANRRASEAHPDFEPTQPMPRRDETSEFIPLSPTQHGRLE